MAGTHRSGRHRLPTALHLLRGTAVRNAKNEPVAPPGLPQPPPNVQADAAALAHWETLSARLSVMAVLTKAHGEALSLLAQSLADYDRVRAQLQSMGYQQLVVDEMRDKEGRIIRRRVRENPLIRRSERLADIVRKLLGEFGLTPITSPKVSAHAVAPTSAASRYISG